ncbi:MAG TPA: hypothetical protein VKA10_02495, partial [Prolixibacteraceae bacterium]|nr:hypothetical protein [Prolixibacteraceae bacterium]
MKNAQLLDNLKTGMLNYFSRKLMVLILIIASFFFFTDSNGQISFSVTAIPDIIDAPGQIDYTITINNTGTEILNNVSVSADLTTSPAYSSGDTNTDGNLDAGEIWTYTASYDVDQKKIDNGSAFINTVTLSADDLVSQTAEATTTVLQVPKLLADLDLINTEYDNVGDEIKYSVALTNTGNVKLKSIEVSDETGWSKKIKDLQVGDIKDYNQSYTVKQEDLDKGSFTNAVSAVAEAPDGTILKSNIVTKSATAIVAASLEISKTADKTEISAPTTINYDIEVANTGDVSLTNPEVTDPFADGATLSSGDTDGDGEIDPDETWVYTADYQATQQDIDDGNDLVNTAGVSTNETSAQQAIATTTISTSAGLAVTKTVTQSNYDSEGDVLNYTIAVENTGNVTISNINVLDALTELNTTITLSAGASQTFNETYTVVQADLDNGSITNTATANGKDPNGADVAASDSETINASISTGLSITKTVAQSNYDSVGDELN